MLLNLDYLVDKIVKASSDALVVGVIDGGFFMDVESVKMNFKVKDMFREMYR